MVGLRRFGRRQHREAAAALLAIGVGVVLFFWLSGLAHPTLTDAQVQAAMVVNINHWSDAPWYLDIDGTPGAPNVTQAARVLTVSSRLPPTASATEAYALCLKVASITHDPQTSVPLPIDKVVIVSGTTFLGRCFPPDS